ncbi:DNA internalization-related competence protein ComEC/Rec2 [Peribacillus tepidiphilus]|uniref:DNA internalization-related competence protein ComEC/Rec2 n=1 Tax=Peribacillus tepidiphilus TaxID=2652445 RepID=UPI0035B53B90
MKQWSILLLVATVFGILSFFQPSFKLFWLIILYLYFLIRFSNWQGFLFSIIIFGMFYSLSFLHQHLQSTKLLEKEHSIMARFSELPEVNGKVLKTIILTPQKEKLLLRYTFKNKHEKMQFLEAYQLGQTCKMEGELILPEKNRNQNAFNYQKYLQQQGITWIFKPNEFPLRFCQKASPSLFEQIKHVRWKGLKTLEKEKNEEFRAFSAALIFGESSWIEEETYQSFQKLGLVHILAISGLHVGMISMIIFYIGIRAGLTRRSVQALLLIILPVYLILAGGSPSVVRACLMVMTYILFQLFRTHISSFDILSLIFSGILMYNPYLLFHIGFQLSFSITFSLLLSERILTRSYKVWDAAANLLTASIISQLSGIPILLYHFYEVSFIGVILNIVYIPLYTVILLPGVMLCYALNMMDPFISSILQSPLEMVLHYSNTIANWFSLLSITSITFGKSNFYTTLLLCGSILNLFLTWEKGFTKKMLTASLFVCMILVYHFSAPCLSPFGEVTFIDVGQGDSILIKQPFGKGNILIDTGGVMNFAKEEWETTDRIFEPGADIVVPFLKSKGIRNLDKLILTHPDQDHIGGAMAVMESISVKELVIAAPSIKEYGNKIETKGKGLKIRLVKRGDTLHIGNIRLYVLGPNENHEDKNEESIVLFAKISNLNWLFTGDLGKKGEEELVKSFPKLKVDVLKIGHHGSKNSTSSIFIRAIKPKVAVISTGKNNRFGHPHSEVLKILEGEGINYFRTDKSGAVSFTYRFNKQFGTFSTQLPYNITN